ncbi:MAG: hypothetical protein KJ831_21360 [Candidatus Eisenbacteria bacterium]|nr:hypothetical protein [Candidatus Eisenbacteria bacterium]
MHICFEYSPQNHVGASAEDAAISGRDYRLILHRRDSSGPIYPHVWERSEPTFYAFFAGRIAGEPIKDAFPAGHAVANRDASDWAMTPEPDGSWLAVKFDRERDTVSFAADFCLLQRWYYTQQGKSWYVSNSLLYLKELIGASWRVNKAAIPYMLMRGYLPLDQTPIAGVYGLRSGRILIIEKDSYRIERRLEPVYFFNEIPNIEAAAVPEEIRGVLKRAVAAEIAHLDAVCIPLSGWSDSRFLLGCVLELLPKEKITAFTFGHKNSLDFQIGSGLAKQAGVRAIELSFDDRPLAELLRDSMRTVEGAYWCYPNHPVSRLRETLKEHSSILSGYIGDLVFGSYDLTPETARRLETSDEYFLEQIHGIADVVPPAEALKLLENQDEDPLKTDQACLTLTANSRENAFAMWLWEDHLFNRTNFAVELHRDLAFYHAPFIHCDVLKFAYSLPKSLRLNQKAYRQAMRQAYPSLWSYPLKNNYGFSPAKKSGARIWAARVFRKAMAGADNLLGSYTGKIHYYHPMDNYEHSRELMQERHRGDVLAALKRLREREAFRTDAMSVLINNYEKRKPISKYLLFGLLTIDLWYQYYEA